MASDVKSVGAGRLADDLAAFRSAWQRAERGEEVQTERMLSLESWEGADRSPHFLNPDGSIDRAAWEAWKRVQPVLHELIDGVPVPLPPARQASRRHSRLHWVATVARDDRDSEAALRWMQEPHPELEKRAPWELSAEGWHGLARVLQLLHAAAPRCTQYMQGAGPHDYYDIGYDDFLDEALTRALGKSEDRGELGSADA